MGNEIKPLIRPLYLQVADLLTARIASGVWKPSAVLPSETELSLEFGISLKTLRSAIEAMEEGALILRLVGSDNFVVAGKPRTE